MMLPGNGLPRNRIDKLAREEAGEIAAALLLRGNETNQTGRSVAKARTLERAEEKQLLL